MKQMRILEALGDVGQASVLEAYEYGRNPAPNRAGSNKLLRAAAPKGDGTTKLLRIAAAAVAAAAVLGCALLVPGMRGLDKLNLSWGMGGMGFEGYLVCDIAELGPGLEDEGLAELRELPVFENPLVLDGAYIASGRCLEEMRAQLIETARRLGLDESRLEITDNRPSDEYIAEVTQKFEDVGSNIPDGYFEPTEVCAEQDGVSISVDMQLTARVEFENPIEIPSEAAGDIYEPDGAQRIGEYLCETYPEWAGAKEAAVCVTGGDRSYDGERLSGYQLALYERSGGAADRLVNSELKKTVAYFDEAGRVYMLRFYSLGGSYGSANYPIISQDEARELLESGRYLTSAPCGYADSKGAERCELVYRSGRYEGYIIPYYRFYAEISGFGEAPGVKCYAAYYVPAISPDYIENMPEDGVLPFNGGPSGVVPEMGFGK